MGKHGSIKFFFTLFNKQMNQVFFMNVLIDTKKSLCTSLQSIQGIGFKKARFVCQKLGFQSSSTFESLDSQDVDLLKAFIKQNFRISNRLFEKVSGDINVLVSSGSYKGRRHKMSYPVRGQRTRTNSKTQRRLSRGRYKKSFKSDSKNVVFKDKFLNSFVNKKSGKRFSNI